MSVYVDALINWNAPGAPDAFRNKPSCHLYADSVEELHAFARRLGLKKAWFQDHRWVKHYDLTEARRVKAVALGAIEHDRRAAVAKWNEIRGGMP